MVEIIYFLIIIIASGLGSISGMGGGIIIKPLMDSFGYHSVSDIAFYSSFSVFNNGDYFNNQKIFTK